MKFQKFHSTTIYLTNDCNLHCPYCFTKKDERSMSYKTGKAVIDFMLNQAKDTKQIRISFFGGEPLLKFQLIKKLVKYGKNQEKIYNKKIKFGITTNGTLFTSEIIDFFKRNNINILFSFEGDKERMVKIKGEKAYRKSVWAIRELKKRGFKITARTTVESDDLKLVDFTKHIFNLGFDSISFVGVAEEKWDQKKTDQAFMKLAEYYISQARKGNILGLNYLNKFLAIKHKVTKPSSTPCGVGRGMIGVTIDGKILPCHHPEAWEQDYILGNVFDGKINEEKRAPFLNYKRDDFIGCNNCLARPYCIGCCLACSYLHTGNMLQPLEGNCIWIRARVKAVEYIYDTLIKKEKNKYLIKRLEKNKIVKPIKLSIDNLKKFQPSENLNYLSFKLNKKDLNKKAGDKIISFLNNLKQKDINFKIARPLPRCLFGSDYIKTIKEFNIQKDYGEHKKKDKKIVKCKNCIYRTRGQCNGI